MNSTYRKLDYKKAKYTRSYSPIMKFTGLQQACKVNWRDIIQQQTRLSRLTTVTHPFPWCENPAEVINFTPRRRKYNKNYKETVLAITLNV
jgi:hypothetical protein